VVFLAKFPFFHCADPVRVCVEGSAKAVELLMKQNLPEKRV
jgi:hypothetical protein